VPPSPPSLTDGFSHRRVTPSAPAWTPVCAVATPIARSLHPASRRYSATRSRSFRFIGLFLTIALPSARYKATSDARHCADRRRAPGWCSASCSIERLPGRRPGTVARRGRAGAPRRSYASHGRYTKCGQRGALRQAQFRLHTRHRASRKHRPQSALHGGEPLISGEDGFTVHRLPRDEEIGDAIMSLSWLTLSQGVTRP
jgi:hypothetical protein